MYNFWVNKSFLFLYLIFVYTLYCVCCVYCFWDKVWFCYPGWPELPVKPRLDVILESSLLKSPICWLLMLLIDLASPYLILSILDFYLTVIFKVTAILHGFLNFSTCKMVGEIYISKRWIGGGKYTQQKSNSLTDILKILQVIYPNFHK